MGVHVVLDIVPQRIDPAAWADAFEETVRLLAAHPARLLGYGFRFIAGVRVPVFTRGVEQGGHDPAERRWCVVGDRATLGTGERQRMYRDLRRYAARAASPAAEVEGDVLVLVLVPAGEADGGHPPRPALGAPARVFGEGEQSPSCQLALLAAAMVVEARFPRDALVSGRFDREQAEVARRWASSVLGRAVALPVRVDAWRLVERLSPHFEGKALVRAVDGLYLAEPGPREAALTGIFGRSALRAQEGVASARAPSPPAAADAPAGDVPAIDVLATRTSPAELDGAQRGRIHALARAVQQGVERGPAASMSVSAQAAVATAVARGGPTLTEDAWDWIEREEDTELRGFLSALAAFDPADQDQAALRRVLLENRALCRYACGLREGAALAAGSR